MSCSLCSRDSDLRASHILPEFLYKGMYGEMPRRMVQINRDPDAQEIWHQKGLRQRLLCDACEQILSSYEGYSNETFFKGLNVQTKPAEKFVQLKGLDYKKIKLFQLSLLWRAAVSTISAFEMVKLGPHAEVIRRMILTENPGEFDEYGCVITLLFDQADRFPEVLIQPVPARIVGQRVYHFVFQGMCFSYFVSSQRAPWYFESVLVKPNGEVSLMTREARDMQFLVDMFADMNRHGKFEAN